MSNTSLSQWCEQHGTFTGVAPLYIAITESACELRDILNASFAWTAPVAADPPAGWQKIEAGPEQKPAKPVLAAVQQARESARVAECDLRLAIQACHGKGAEFMVLHGLAVAFSRVYQKLVELAGQLEDSAQ